MTQTQRPTYEAKDNFHISNGELWLKVTRIRHNGEEDWPVYNEPELVEHLLTKGRLSILPPIRIYIKHEIREALLREEDVRAWLKARGITDFSC